MRERCMYGSVRGARGNLRSYRDRQKRVHALMTRNPGLVLRGRFAPHYASARLTTCRSLHAGYDIRVLTAAYFNFSKDPRPWQIFV